VIYKVTEVITNTYFVQAPNNHTARRMVIMNEIVEPDATDINVKEAVRLIEQADEWETE
jgi:hypothetical protein